MPQGRSVWIEAEQWDPGSWTASDCNTDVQVTLADGSRWGATFFTYKNVLSLASKNKLTGECLHGQYFWAPHMILVYQVTREMLEQVIDDLIQTGEFTQVFARLP